MPIFDTDLSSICKTAEGPHYAMGDPQAGDSYELPSRS